MSVKYGFVGRPPQLAKKKKTGYLDASYMLALYAIAVGITPEFTFMGIPKVRITDLLLPVIFLFCSDPKRSQKKAVFPLIGLFSLLFLWNVGSLVGWGTAPLSPGVFYLAKRLEFFLVAYAAFRGISEVSQWNRVIRLMVFSSPLLSFTVLQELFSNIASGGVLATGEGMRASGIIAQQQTSTAMYIVVVSCISLGAWDSFKDARWRLGTLAALSAGCVAIFATGSRGGLACVALSVVLVAMQNRKRGCGLLILSLMIASVGWMVVPTALRQRLSGLFPETAQTFNALTDENVKMAEYGSSSIADRVLVARKVWAELLPESGLMGLGTGFKKLGAIDDLYLTEWVYHGFIGLVMFGALQVCMIMGCLRIVNISKDPVEQGVARGAATALIAMSASGIHADTFYLIRPMEALALLLGLVAARRVIE